MKKATTSLILVIQLLLLFVFQSLNAWFTEFSNVDLTEIKDPLGLTANFQHMQKMFSVLTIVSGLFVLATVFYLAYQFKKPRESSRMETLPPLQSYLLQLKGSENQLKTLVQEQQLHVNEKEELNKSIVNNINSAVIVLNRHNRIDIFNPAAQEMFTQSFVNAKNNTLDKVLAAFPEIADFLDHHEGNKISGEVKTRQQVFYVHLNPLENIGQLILIREITEEKRREDIDRRNNNFIMLGEMAAFLAHEVRNSLGVIYGYSKTIKAESEKNKIDKVNKEINFLTTMMESFLNFSRPVQISRNEAVELTSLVQKVAAESDIAVTVEIADMPPGQEDTKKEFFLKTDPALIQSVFSNLMLNARQAGADLVQVAFSHAGDGLPEFTVSDNGNGINEENREKIWFPFFTTKTKGTGMGLPIIRKVINSLNGEITLEESSAKGTVFKLTFYPA